jgi:hypothetical protein
MTNSQPGQITLKEILQQPKLWPTTLERIKLQDPSVSSCRQTVICGAFGAHLLELPRRQEPAAVLLAGPVGAL